MLRAHATGAQPARGGRRWRIGCREPSGGATQKRAWRGDGTLEGAGDQRGGPGVVCGPAREPARARVERTRAARRSDLPPRYGKHKTVRKRFSRWADQGVWGKGLAALIAAPSNGYVMLDASLLKAHQQAATGKKGATKTRRWGVPEED